MFRFRSVSAGIARLGEKDPPHKYNKTRARHYPHKDWYNQECELKRKEYMQFKNKYRQLKNVNNLNLLRQAGRDFKK